MDPITLAAGAMAVGGLVQLYNSEKARGAEADRLQKIEDLFNKIKPPDYDLSITDPPKLHEEMLALPKFSSPVEAPKFNLDKLNPQELKLVGKYVPEVAPLIQEKAPELIQKTGDMKSGRDAQLNALRRFQEIGAGEFDPEYQEQVTRASRAAQADAQSRQQSILQDFARRGQSGSGLALAAQMGGASQAMDREAMTNLGAASEAYRNRLSALSQGAQLGGQISNQDVDLQARNTGIINAFNQRMSSANQAYQNNRAGALNNAQQYNLGAEQGLSNENIRSQNDANASNQRRLDDLAKYGYNTSQQQQQRQDELAKWGFGAQQGERNYANQLAMSKYALQAGEKDKLNALRTQQYQNQLAKTQGKAGISGQIGANNLSAAQDRNSALQGLANVGMTYAQGSQANNNALRSQLAADDRATYQNTGAFMDEDQLDARKERYQSDYY